MPRRAWLFLIPVVAAGSLVALWAILTWRSPDPVEFGLATCLGLLVSAHKIQLPRLTATISGGFAFVLFAAALFDSQGTVILALIVALAQTVWRPATRPKWYQIAFNGANIALCAGLADAASALAGTGGSAARMAFAGLLLFLANTLSVSVIGCLASTQPLASIWEACRWWAAPYYMAGGILAGALASGDPQSALLRALALAASLTAISRFYGRAVSYVSLRSGTVVP